MSAHGTRGCYVQGCRCADCREANRLYYHKTNRQKVYGVWQPDRVPAHDVRAHVDWLRANGMGYRAVAANAGVARSTIAGLYKSRRTGQRREFVRRETAQLILNVSFDSRLGIRVDATGTRRRLQALIAVGWSNSQLAQRLGWNRSNFISLLTGNAVRKSTEMKVRRLYDELWDQRPSAETRWDRAAITRSLRRAATHGWAPPMAWDDDTIDDPMAEPSIGEKLKRTFEDVLEDWYDTLDDHGGDVTLAAARLDMTPDALERALYRARAGGQDIAFTRTLKRWAS